MIKFRLMCLMMLFVFLASKADVPYNQRVIVYEGQHYRVTDEAKREVMTVYYGRVPDKSNFVIPSTVIDENGVEFTVTEIGEESFKDCSNLFSVEIPETIITIGDSAFEGCWRLTSASISGKVKSLGKNVFKHTGFTSFSCPEGIVEIGEGMFYQCTRLESVGFPGSV